MLIWDSGLETLNVCQFIKVKTGCLLTFYWTEQLSPNQYSEQVPHCSSYIINLPQSITAELHLHCFYTPIQTSFHACQRESNQSGKWILQLNIPKLRRDTMLAALYKQCNVVWVQDNKSIFMRLKWYKIHLLSVKHSPPVGLKRWH